MTLPPDNSPLLQKPLITIEYCTKCRWLMRSAWLAQEALSTFETSLYGITLKPSLEAGTFIISCNEKILWDRKKDGGFPEAKILKQRIRNYCFPEKDLGHSDCNPNDSCPT